MELDYSGLLAMGEAADESLDETQYLTFRLDSQEYGLPIIEVQEIKGWTSMTPVPNSPSHMLGVLNLRGTIIPVIDLRTRFGLPPKEHDGFTVIMVVSMGKRLAGLVVDSVSDVISAPEEAVRDNPEANSNIDQRFFRGLVESNGKLVILLDAMQISDDIQQGS
ncbi:MAG: chemotaxis protein CheW [Acidiferrobacterales bacterium]|nr:chemotaxis protein CheW [Acidiferrobacterales bacterium]